jgi:hypothetical protein
MSWSCHDCRSRLGRAGPVGLQYCLYAGFPCRESVYCNVVHALEKENIEDLESLRPTLRQTTKDSEKDPQGYEHEREQNKIDYVEDRKRFNDRIQNRQEALVAAYGLIWSDYMTKAMRERIEEHPDYDAKIKQNPVELLLAIKHSMHNA